MRPRPIPVSLLILLGFLAACSLPRGAALQSEILATSDVSDGELAVYTVDKSLLPVIAKWPRTGFEYSDGWISRQRGPTNAVIATGDLVQISIWDNDENSLLTIPTQKSVNLNEMVVSPDGTIFIPYIDRVFISGMTQDAARETIQSELEKIIVSAQVQVKLISGRRNSVDLVGGVAAAGSFPLPDRNFSVLNLISLGGGISSGLRNPQIKLVRGSKVYTNSVERLYSHPNLDTTLRGGDKVIVSEDNRYFLSLGAAGTEDLMYFTKDSISALDAMSIIGGLSDTRANPQAILILRQYPEKAVRSDGKGPSNTRAVFNIDLTSADGLFSAKEFAINPGDLVLVTESVLPSLSGILTLFNTSTIISDRFN